MSSRFRGAADAQPDRRGHSRPRAVRLTLTRCSSLASAGIEGAARPGGTPFQPGQDKRTISLRSSLGVLNATQLSELQSAVAALRSLPKTDPRTWVLQADLHALYCQQCFNDSTQIHFKWNFFPWHRAYLYFYERILGSLVNNLDGFRLPYWNWESARSMPSVYRTPAAVTNSLWDQNRDAGIATGGNLPAAAGSMPRILQLNALQDFATFGGTSVSAGACEGNRRGLIHNDVGRPYPVYVDMGDLGFAARDPLFFAHHCNIDKIWSNWNALASGGGLPAVAYKNPSDPAFLNATWSFYDENGKAVSIRAADVLDHPTNLRYSYTPAHLRIPPSYEIIRCRLICCGPDPERAPFLEFSSEALQTVMSAAREQQPDGTGAAGSGDSRWRHR